MTRRGEAVLTLCALLLALLLLIALGTLEPNPPDRLGLL